MIGSRKHWMIDKTMVIVLIYNGPTTAIESCDKVIHFVTPFASNYRMKWAESQMKKMERCGGWDLIYLECGVFPAFKSLVALHDVYETGPAIGWGRSSFIFVFLPQFLVFFRKFANNSWETASFYGVKGRFHCVKSVSLCTLKHGFHKERGHMGHNKKLENMRQKAVCLFAK